MVSEEKSGLSSRKWPWAATCASAAPSSAARARRDGRRLPVEHLGHRVLRRPRPAPRRHRCRAPARRASRGARPPGPTPGPAATAAPTACSVTGRSRQRRAAGPTGRPAAPRVRRPRPAGPPVRRGPSRGGPAASRAPATSSWARRPRAAWRSVKRAKSTAAAAAAASPTTRWRTRPRPATSACRTPSSSASSTSTVSSSASASRSEPTSSTCAVSPVPRACSSRRRTCCSSRAARAWRASVGASGCAGLRQTEVLRTQGDQVGTGLRVVAGSSRRAWQAPSARHRSDHRSSWRASPDWSAPSGCRARPGRHRDRPIRARSSWLPRVAWCSSRAWRPRSQARSTPPTSPAVSRRLASASQPRARVGPVGALAEGGRLLEPLVHQRLAPGSARTRAPTLAPSSSTCGSSGAAASRAATDQRLEPDQQPGGASGLLGTRRDREQLGPDPVPLAPLAPEQAARRVRCRPRACPVTCSRGRSRECQPEVCLLDVDERTSVEGTLHHLQRIGRHARGEVDAAPVVDEVHAGHVESVEAVARVRVGLERAGQVALEEGEPPHRVDPDGQGRPLAQGRVDLHGLCERASRGVQVAEPGPGRVPRGGARGPSRRRRPNPSRISRARAQVVGACLEALQREAQDACPAHEHAGQRQSVELGGGAVELGEALARAPGVDERAAQRRTHVARALAVDAAAERAGPGAGARAPRPYGRSRAARCRRPGARSRRVPGRGRARARPAPSLRAPSGSANSVRSSSSASPRSTRSPSLPIARRKAARTPARGRTDGASVGAMDDWMIGDDRRRRSTDQLRDLRKANDGQVDWNTEAPADFTYLFHPDRVLVGAEDVEEFEAAAARLDKGVLGEPPRRDDVRLLGGELVRYVLPARRRARPCRRCSTCSRRPGCAAVLPRPTTGSTSPPAGRRRQRVPRGRARGDRSHRPVAPGRAAGEGTRGQRRRGRHRMAPACRDRPPHARG